MLILVCMAKIVKPYNSSDLPKKTGRKNVW